MLGRLAVTGLTVTVVPDQDIAVLKSAAREGNSRILLPAGAVGGIDAIAAMRLGGLSSVRYRSRKPHAPLAGSTRRGISQLFGTTASRHFS